jgi:hypothetical protein
MFEERLKWMEAYMPEDIRKLLFFCLGMYSSNFDLWILVSNAHLIVKLLPVQLERFVLSKWHVLYYTVLYIPQAVELVLDAKELWWWMKLQLSITTSTNMSDLFWLWKLQGSFKHDYILFIELIVPSVATTIYNLWMYMLIDNGYYSSGLEWACMKFTGAISECQIL